jgi:N-hydroxyarylamine O-acetyltransferase
MENISFENLDIVVGRKIALDYPHLFAKIISKKRGGYFFELNTLYAELLKSLGFFPRPVLGRVWLSNPRKMPPRNHLAHLVDLDGKTYLTDVGFGGLITRIPLDIKISSPIDDKDGTVRIVPFANHQFMITRQIEKGWENQYSFENVEVSEEDIYISNYYMSTNPRSHFFEHKFVGKNTKDGRIGLFNNKMSIRKGIKIMDKKRVNFGKDWIEIIKNEFSLNLDFSEKEFKVLFK